MRWAIAVHGGAGDWARADEDAALTGVRLAVEAAAQCLAADGSALAAVVAAVTLLEDDPLFNAGTGSVLNRDGQAELDASVMDGSTLMCGGVGAIRDVRNPVQVAQRVMQATPHVLLVGDGARAFARDQGFAEYDPVTQRARMRWRAASRPPAAAKRVAPGTVGAVALDSAGRFAAATSTGGVMLKLPGRVGDSPIPGAGNYANGVAACSATGRGELMLRTLAAKALCDRVARGEGVRAAVDAQFEVMQRAVGSDCGFLLLSRDAVAAGHRTAAMPHAWQCDDDPRAFVAMRVASRHAR